MNWVQEKLGHAPACHRLYDYLAQHEENSGLLNREIRDALRHGIDAISTEAVAEAYELTEWQSPRNPGLAAAVMQTLLNETQTEHRLLAFLRYNIYAQSLGWACSPETALGIASVLPEGVDLDEMQSRALIQLGYARSTSGRRTPGQSSPHYSPSVLKVVIERPHDIQRIIEIEQRNPGVQGAQLTRLLNGKIMATFAGSVN
jgi:hypothetical protein